jgi:hypothetical protein
VSSLDIIHKIAINTHVQIFVDTCISFEKLISMEWVVNYLISKETANCLSKWVHFLSQVRVSVLPYLC